MYFNINETYFNNRLTKYFKNTDPIKFFGNSPISWIKDNKINPLFLDIQESYKTLCMLYLELFPDAIKNKLLGDNNIINDNTLDKIYKELYNNTFNANYINTVNIKNINKSIYKLINSINSLFKPNKHLFVSTTYYDYNKIILSTIDSDILEIKDKSIFEIIRRKSLPSNIDKYCLIVAVNKDKNNISYIIDYKISDIKLIMYRDVQSELEIIQNFANMILYDTLVTHNNILLPILTLKNFNSISNLIFHIEILSENYSSFVLLNNIDFKKLDLPVSPDIYIGNYSLSYYDWDDNNLEYILKKLPSNVRLYTIPYEDISYNNTHHDVIRKFKNNSTEAISKKGFYEIFKKELYGFDTYNIRNTMERIAANYFIKDTLFNTYLSLVKSEISCFFLLY